MRPSGKSKNITFEFPLLPLSTKQMFYLKEVSKPPVEGRAAGVYLEHTGKQDFYYWLQAQPMAGSLTPPQVMKSVSGEAAFLPFPSFFFLFLSLLIYFETGETESVSGGGAERGRERISDSALSAETPHRGSNS